MAFAFPIEVPCGAYRECVPPHRRWGASTLLTDGHSATVKALLFAKSHVASQGQSLESDLSPSHNFPDGLMDESNDLFFRTTVLVLVWPHEEDTLPHGSGAWPLRKSP